MNNQNKQKGNIDIEVSLILLAISIGLFTVFNQQDISRLEKHDTCLTQTITELPDPNDTTERSILLANCMDK